MRKRGPAAGGRNGKWKIGLLTAVLLSVFVTAMAAQLSGADPLDLNKQGSCSVTVDPIGERTEYGGDLSPGSVQVDLYKVADAIKVEGYDTYKYSLVTPFSGNEELEKALGEAADLSALTAETWEKLVSAAESALTNDLEPDYTATGGVKCPGMDPGLYLLRVRGGSVSTPTYTYTFDTELISLPGKTADTSNPSSTDQNPREWVYDVKVTLKPDRVRRTGSLEIVKTLQFTDPNEPVKPGTFVFHVYYTMPAGVPQRPDEIVTISFVSNDELTKRTRIDGIPVGTMVRVVEVYSGATYEYVTTPEQTGGPIAAGSPTSLPFINRDNGDNREGYGITNSFEYESSDGWKWRADPPQAAQQ